jgi:arginase
LKSIAIIEAPSILGLRPTGVEHLPDALVSAGLLVRLQRLQPGVGRWTDVGADEAGNLGLS